jgi:hypothetical protein
LFYNFFKKFLCFKSHGPRSANIQRRWRSPSTTVRDRTIPTITIAAGLSILTVPSPFPFSFSLCPGLGIPSGSSCSAEGLSGVSYGPRVPRSSLGVLGSDAAPQPHRSLGPPHIFLTSAPPPRAASFTEHRIRDKEDASRTCLRQKLHHRSDPCAH